MAKRKNPVFFVFFNKKGNKRVMKGQRSLKEELRRRKNLILTLSKERSGIVKGHSVNVTSISLPLSPSISLAFSPLSFCFSSRRYLQLG